MVIWDVIIGGSQVKMTWELSVWLIFFLLFKLLVSLYKQFFKVHIGTDLSVGERRDLPACNISPFLDHLLSFWRTREWLCPLCTDGLDGILNQEAFIFPSQMHPQSPSQMSSARKFPSEPRPRDGGQAGLVRLSLQGLFLLIRAMQWRKEGHRLFLPKCPNNSCYPCLLMACYSVIYWAATQYSLFC